MKILFLLLFLSVVRVGAADALFVTAGLTAFPARLITGAGAATVTGELLVDGLGETAAPSWAGKIVLMDRGVITFQQKVQTAQAAGAIGVIVADNVPGLNTATLGAGNSATLPAVTITQSDGVALKIKGGATVRLGKAAPPPAPIALPDPVGQKGAVIGSDGEKLVWVKLPPVVIGAETVETVARGGRFALSVMASGLEPFTIQWLKGGEPIEGATSVSFTIPAATAADAGTYSCRVTNSAGTAVSNVLALVVK